MQFNSIYIYSRFLTQILNQAKLFRWLHLHLHLLPIELIQTKINYIAMMIEW